MTELNKYESIAECSHLEEIVTDIGYKLNKPYKHNTTIVSIWIKWQCSKCGRYEWRQIKEVIGPVKI